jgi:type III pantothenate kinase
MLLVMNINNTNTKFGLYRGSEWIAHWRVASDRAKMPDEYAMLVRIRGFRGTTCPAWRWPASCRR